MDRTLLRPISTTVVRYLAPPTPAMFPIRSLVFRPIDAFLYEKGKMTDIPNGFGGTIGQPSWGEQSR